MNALSTCSPLREFTLFPSRLSGLADALFGEATAARNWVPPVNVTEDADAYHVSAELPDVALSDVKVVMSEGVLTIRGERKQETKTEGMKYHLVERSQGTFRRSFRLPKDANSEKVAAEFKNGVLLVTIAKHEEVKPREIEVQVK